MKTLNIDIDYHRSKAEMEKSSNIEVSEDYINALVINKFPQLQGQKLRIFGRIQRKLDDAVANNLSSIDLEEAEVDLLKDACKDPSFVSRLAKYAVVMIDQINNL